MLPPGTKLGPYEILALIGVGGMGEVYRARDGRLQRDVAVKVLPAALVSDPARRQRFAKEAQAASALNHPHVVSVFDVNLSGEFPYIVYELVEGATLRHSLGKPMPPKRILELAVQIADGLAAAHQLGMMHRDLKPENIILTRDGRAKILDFGLAKLDRSMEPSGQDAQTVTVLTVEGNLVGTVQYMSPEQAAGRPADRRADVFSFGLILYEMAVGQRPFDRKSAVETLSAVINDDAPPIEGNLPLPLRLTIGRCLQKEPDQRYESTRDLLADLRSQRDYGASVTQSQSGLTATSQGTVQAPTPRRPLPWGKIFIATAALLAGVLGGLSMEPAGTTPGIAANQFLPLATSAAREEWPVWSPDGKTIAYQAVVSGAMQIFTRGNSGSSAPLQVTRSSKPCHSPQWSADGRRIFFLSERSVHVVGAAGGEPELILREADAMALTPDGESMAIVRRTASPNVLSLLLSSPPGAEPVKYRPAPFEGPDFNSALLTFSPDGKQLLLYVSIVAMGRPSEFWLLPVPPKGSGSPRRVLESLADSFPVRGASWIPGGWRVVVAHTLRPDVYRSHLSIADLKTGRVEPLLTGIGSEGSPSVSRDGKHLAYMALDLDTRIVQIPLDGSAVTDLVSTSRSEHGANWSAQTREFAYVTDQTGEDEVWIADPERGRDRPIVTQKSFDKEEMPLIDSPAFSPSGDRIAFSRAARIWIAPVSGGAPVRLTPLQRMQLAPTWSPDGNWIAFYSRGDRDGVMKARVGGGGDPILVYQTDARQCPFCTPDWSPRGDWIAFYTNQGTALLSPEPGRPSRVIRTPPLQATGWSRDGGTLYGVAGENGKQRIVAIEIASGREHVVSEIPSGVRLGTLWSPGLRLSVSADGKSLATTAMRYDGDIWTVRDFDPGVSWMVRLGLR